MNIVRHWHELSATLEQTHTRLLAVSKYTTDEAVKILFDAGQIDFAESRPQNLRDRAARFPQAHWHFIGPLQKNKAKYIAQYAHMWHSLENIETARAVAKHLHTRTLPSLIQVNISGEAQKHGVMPEALPSLYEQLQQLPQLQIIGLMGMAAKHDDPRPAFQKLHQLQGDFQQAHGIMPELCMGMSGDWRIAIQEGATMVRLGSTLFSEYPVSNH